MDQRDIGTFIFSQMLPVIQSTPEYNDKQRINRAFNEIHRIYKTSLTESTPTLFDDPAKRIAYFYLYFSGICAATKIIWLNIYNSLDYEDKSHFSNVLRKNNVSICSIGGGPGTDVIAFHSFLVSIGFGGVTEASVWDSAIQWKDLASRVIQRCDLGYRRSMICNYFYFNFARNYDAFDVRTSLSNADVVSIVKFFSAVSNVASRYDMLQKMISGMKPGSLLFFVDNFGSNVQSALRRTFQSADFTCMYWEAAVDETISLNYQQVPGFEFKPQRKLKVFATVWKKNSTKINNNNYNYNYVQPVITRPPSVTNRTVTVSNRPPSVTNRTPSVTNRPPTVTNRTVTVTNRPPSVTSPPPVTNHSIRPQSVGTTRSLYPVQSYKQASVETSRPFTTVGSYYPRSTYGQSVPSTYGQTPGSGYRPNQPVRRSNSIDDGDNNCRPCCVIC